MLLSIVCLYLFSSLLSPSRFWPQLFGCGGISFFGLKFAYATNGTPSLIRKRIATLHEVPKAALYGSAHRASLQIRTAAE